jgi:hypothetical protein
MWWHVGGFKPALARVAGRHGTDAGGAPDPGAAVCGLARCGRSCGSTLGGRPHGICMDYLWPPTRVSTQGGFGAAYQVLDEKPQRGGSLVVARRLEGLRL